MKTQNYSSFVYITFTQLKHQIMYSNNVPVKISNYNEQYI
jgi:hypothetical protein